MPAVEGAAPSVDGERIQVEEARARRDSAHDRRFGWLLKLCALLVLAALLGATLVTLTGGWSAFSTYGWHFLVDATWHPDSQHPDDPSTNVFGALVPIVGTLVTSLIALVLAVPFSFGIALFLSEVAPRWLRTPVTSAIELLAGIPSIIFGMWGLLIFAPFFQAHAKPWIDSHLGVDPDTNQPSWIAAHIPLVGKLLEDTRPFGGSVLTAGIVLAIMILPFISSVMREVFQTVPTRLKESAYALGSSTWEVAWDIMLPYTRAAVIGGIFLGLGRALGETMAVTLIIGNSMDLSPSLLDQGATISSTIANQFSEAAGLQKSSLMALAFLLFVVTFIVLLIARLMLRRLAAKEGN